MTYSIAGPSTPSGPSSSQTSSLYSPSSASDVTRVPRSPTFLRTPTIPSTPIGPRRQRFAPSTPPSSPPLPSQAEASGTKTIHLYSPKKPSTSTLVSVSPKAQRSSSFVIKGNVTPSRASTFFAPRPKRRNGPAVSPRFGIVMPATSPSSQTSARRGSKRVCVGSNESSTSRLASRQRADRIVLSQSDDEDDESSEEEDSEAEWYGRWRQRDYGEDDRGVRRVSNSLSRGPLSPPGRVRQRHGRASTPTNATPGGPGSLSGSITPSPCKPVPLALKGKVNATKDLAAMLSTMRCGSGGSLGRVGISTVALRASLSQSSAHATFVSHPLKSTYTIPSRHHEGFAQPLCSAYSHSSRAYSQGPQWLAVGDGEGTLTLVDTSVHDTTADNYVCPYTTETISRPSWDASTGSVFSLSWRYDDRLLASSGADYSIRIWDTTSGRLARSFRGSRGTARAIEWDPFGGGNLLASGGRDGAVHIYDLRTANSKPNDAVINLGNAQSDGESLDLPHSTEPLNPRLSLWSAHAPDLKGKRRYQSMEIATKGVTSILYHRRREHNLITTGCNNARVKLWDLRFAMATDDDKITPASGAIDKFQSPPRTPGREPFAPIDTNAATSQMESSSKPLRKTRKPRKARPGSPSFVLGGLDDSGADDETMVSGPLAIRPAFESDDFSLSVGGLWNARAHGISSLVADDSNKVSGTLGAGETLWAACTDGRVYGVPYDMLEPGGPALNVRAGHGRVTTLFHPSQLGNSLYNRMALAPDGRTLALGCNSGDVVVWDTKARTPTVLQRRHDESTPRAGAHERNCEVNCLSWCYGSRVGWKLASAGDDCVIRTWEMDRDGALAQAFSL